MDHQKYWRFTHERLCPFNHGRLNYYYYYLT